MTALFADTYYFIALLSPNDVMQKYGLSEALTGDHHFRQAGFRALLK